MTEFSFRKRSLHIPHVLIILIVTALLLLLWQANVKFKEAVQKLQVIAVPFNQLIMLPTHLLHDVHQHWHTQDDLLDQNKSLQTSLLLANQKIEELEATNQENKALHLLAETQHELKKSSWMALVISFSQREERYTINKGSSDGIKAGMAVIAAKGVLGQVVAVSHDTATVHLLTAPDCAIPVMDERSGITAVAQGKGHALVLSTLAKTSDVKEGDVFYTTGLDGVYPPHVPVGRAVSVDSVEADKFMQVSLEPLAKLYYQQAILVVGAS